MVKKERITGALYKQCHKARLLFFTKRHTCWHPSRERFEEPIVTKLLHSTLAFLPCKRIIANKQKVSIPSYSSWERALNENTNGLIPQYFPKLQSLNNISQKELNYIMGQLNYRLRKTLDFKTPYKLFFKKNTLLTVVLHTWIRQSIYEKERFWFLLVSHPHSFDKNSKDSDKNTLGAT